MANPNDATILRNELEKLLLTLKRNRENVSLSLLKTKYAAGYTTLCNRIKQTVSAYLKTIILCDIRLHSDYIAEGVALIQKSIDDSGLLKQLSKAVYCHQSLSDFDLIATQLHERILSDLENFYYQHLGLYVTRRSLEEPYPSPEVYCFANNCILQEGTWIPLEKFKKSERTSTYEKF